MIWGLLVGLTVGLLVYTITVAVLNAYNLKKASEEAIQKSGQDEARELVGRALTGVVGDIKKKGGITTVSINLLDREEKVGEVRINSPSVSGDIRVGKRIEEIRTC